MPSVEEMLLFISIIFYELSMIFNPFWHSSSLLPYETRLFERLSGAISCGTKGVLSSRSRVRMSRSSDVSWMRRLRPGSRSSRRFEH